jgi:putative transposase
LRERKANRLKGYDYSSEGVYYLTICTHEKGPVFGHIDNGKMILNKYGMIARECWKNIPEHFRKHHAPQNGFGDSAEDGSVCAIPILDEFVIMPDHIHGIIALPEDADHELNHIADQACLVRTESREHQKIPKIIGSYKSAVSKLIHESGHSNFRWHKSYYDRIIRNEKELNRIRRYIINNPIRGSHKRDPYG